MSSRTSPHDLTLIKGYPKTLQIYRIGASKYWQVRLFVGRKYQRKSTKCISKQDAIVFAKKFFDEIKIAQRLGGDVHRDTFSACAEGLMKRQASLVATGQRNARIIGEDRKKLDLDILPFFGNKAVASITTSMLDDYIATIGVRKLSPSTVSKHLVVIRKVLGEAQRRGYLGSLPVFPSVKRKDNPRPYFPHPELFKLLEKVRELAKSDIKVRYVPLTEELADFISFAVVVFIRPSDLKLLKHRHIRKGSYKEGGKLVEYLSIIPPNSKTVVKESLSMPQAVTSYTRQIARQNSRGLAEPDDYVFFPEFRNREYALATIRRQFDFALKEAGLEKDRYDRKRTLYSLRHSALVYRIQTSEHIDIFALAKNALTSVDQLERFYLSHVELKDTVRNLMSIRKS